MLGTDQRLIGFEMRRVDVPEFAKQARTMIAKLDKDRDGALDEKERKKSKQLSDADFDEDGVVTLREIVFEGVDRSQTSSREGGMGMEQNQPPDYYLRELWATLLRGSNAYKYDRNGDRAWDFDTEFREVVFRTLDRDRSDALEPAEAAQLPFSLAPPRLGDRPKRHGPLAMDRNGNGKVSLREFRLAKDVEDLLDLNSNGVIEEREFPGGVSQTMTPQPVLLDPEVLLRTFDRNGDGAVTARELRRDGAPLGGDQNNDGKLDENELLQLVAQSRQNGLDRASDDGLRRFDLDRDGRISRREFPGPGYLFSLRVVL